MKSTNKLLRKRSPKNSLNKLLCIRLNDEELINVEQLALEESRSRASFVRILILLGLTEFERKRLISNQAL